MTKNKIRLSFIENIQFYANGQLVNVLADYQEQVIEHLKKNGGKAEISLILKFEMKGETIDVKPVPKIKIPDMNIKPSTMFLTDENKLTPDDPQQMTIRDFQEEDDNENHLKIIKAQ